MKKLQHRGWNSNSTLTRAIKELVQRKLLRYTKRCGPNVYHQASMFAFTDLPVPDNERHGIASSQPTHDYVKWVPTQTKKKNRAHSDTVSNDTATRCETSPLAGERDAGTVPCGGDPEEQWNPGPVLALQAINGANHTVTVSR
ncbi:MAG: hypothetical protein E6H66_23190 [Betaproteobacteria bacterium]|nr:MAG: hypothetical protein E6H66_23190 [Betaproteobacteria bacterium]